MAPHFFVSLIYLMEIDTTYVPSHGAGFPPGDIYFIYACRCYIDGTKQIEVAGVGVFMYRDGKLRFTILPIIYRPLTICTYTIFL